jgi:amino acid transporter
MAEMSRMKKMPRAFSLRNRSNVPWQAVIVLTAMAVVFTISNSLESIAAFSSMIFLLVSIAVSIANLKLRKQTGSRMPVILAGLVFMLATVATLMAYLWINKPHILVLAVAIFLVVVIIELLFSRRRIWRRSGLHVSPPEGPGCSDSGPDEARTKPQKKPIK